MATAVFVLGALASTTCAGLLLRGYRQTRVRLVGWSALFFVGLMLNNLLLVIDKVLVPHDDLATARAAVVAAGAAALVWGLIWDDR